MKIKSKATKYIEKVLFHKYDTVTNHCAFEVKIGFSKAKKKIWNLGIKNILIESMVRSLARDAKKYYSLSK